VAGGVVGRDDDGVVEDDDGVVVDHDGVGEGVWP